MEDMFRPLRRYADFRGRARRREYWLFILLSWLVIATLAAAGLLAGWDRTTYESLARFQLPPGAGLIDKILIGTILAVLAALLIPTLAVQVRRFHDRGRSAWMLLWTLIPYFGELVIFVHMALPGTEGPNRYGPDPTEQVDEWGRVIA
jgi:uncharacterized membrane protein YhaH (DUF805 family)